jgi:SAM-dependent methyltransferase
MTACNACGLTGIRPVPGPQARWRYWQCVHCGHAWLQPAPGSEELTAYYNTAYTVPRDLYVAGVTREYPALRALLQRHGIKPGRMLELGCSYGAMLDAFRRDGWDVEGIELDARAVEVARSHYGLRVHQGQISEVSALLVGDYDLIALYHVLEHVADPRAFVSDLAGLCKPGGAVLVKTPNARSFLARALGGWWEWFAAPEHLQLFSPLSLCRLLEDKGLTIELMVSRRGDANGTLFEMLRAAARPMVRRPPLGERSIGGGPTGGPTPVSARPSYRRIRALIDAVGAPLDWLLSRFYPPPYLLGPELLVLARKPREVTPTRP